MIRVGIFFGGPSREREISFAGGRTVFDNLNKGVFEPVLLFVDSQLNLIQLDWHLIYKGTVRDFFPPAKYLPDSIHGFQVYDDSLVLLPDYNFEQLASEVGRPMAWTNLPNLIEVAFLALHGNFGEDGQIQSVLETIGIPYTGSGVRASAIGMDKGFQKKLMHAGGFKGPVHKIISRQKWITGDPLAFYQQACSLFGDKLVIRPANQGSSIGVSILQLRDPVDFVQAMDKAFFRMRLTGDAWRAMTEAEQIQWIRQIGDLRDGLGFPLKIEEQVFAHPEQLLNYLRNDQSSPSWVLDGFHKEYSVLLEGFISGKEFSCIVIRTDEDHIVALPPTEIRKGSDVFDYRSKYLPGLSRKITPIDLPEKDINAIRSECERLFHYLEFQVYARIDGFILPNGDICLNDPNTTSGMLPSSFFFHQAAEIGLNPSQFLTYIIHQSLSERAQYALFEPSWSNLIARLNGALNQQKREAASRRKIAVILGGYSSERHISLESGRNIYEKLASSDKYEPIPVFLTGSEGKHQLYVLPIPLLLKDNADDIAAHIEHKTAHPVLEAIRRDCRHITAIYGYDDAIMTPLPVTYAGLADMVDGVFIALHGRPGEDGEVQTYLSEVGLPFNGSSVASSQVTIHKYQTLQTLKANGFPVADQLLIQKQDWVADTDTYFQRIESRLAYPMIGKPVDDGCSSAVKILRNRLDLSVFSSMLFRETTELDPEDARILGIKPNEEIPRKTEILFESLITANGAQHFLEITGGLMTKWINGQLHYTVFEPSEALAGGAVLSLEEKFLAGEGQNITPARFAKDAFETQRISDIVKADFEKAACLLNVTGYARIDAFVRIFSSGKVETIIIEVNSLPGMTPATCIFHQAALENLTPYRFIDEILEFSFHERQSPQHV